MPASLRFSGPIPMDLAATVMRVIGTLYPSTTIGTPGFGESMVLHIADEDRGITDEVLAEVAELKEMAEATTAELEVIKTDGSSIQTTTGSWLASMLVPVGKAFLDSVGAENYVEQEVIDGAGPSDGELELTLSDVGEPGVRYVFSIARSPEQTPHQLRQKAEAELERIRAAVEAAHIPDEAKAEILG